MINSLNGSLSPFAFSFVNLQQGIYYINATAEDNAGNINATPTITITLQSSNNQTNQSNQTNPLSNNIISLASPYSYNDVYNQYHQQQKSNTAPALNLEATPQANKSSQNYAAILIAETLLVICVLITTIIIAARKLKK